MGPDDKALQLLYCKLRGSDRYIGAHLHRYQDTKIMRPHSTEGWIWGHELAAIKRAGLVDEIEFVEGWRMVSKCEKRCPLAEVASLYNTCLLYTSRCV